MGEITLESELNLHWYEFGESTGFPVLYFHGLFGSAFEAAQADDIAKQLGIRLIAPDLPGVYRSSVIPSYTLDRYMKLITPWLLQHLALDRFAVLGFSGGGVFALACAYYFSEQVKTVSVVSCTSSFETDVMQQNINPALKPLYDVTLTERKFAIQQFKPLGTSVENLLQSFEPVLSEADASLMGDSEIAQNVFESCTRALHQGVEGYVDNIRAIRLPWSFKLQDIKLPVNIWQGQDDKITPHEIGEYLARETPESSYYSVDSCGHFFLYAQWHTVLNKIK